MFLSVELEVNGIVSFFYISNIIVVNGEQYHDWIIVYYISEQLPTVHVNRACW